MVHALSLLFWAVAAVSSAMVVRSGGGPPLPARRRVLLWSLLLAAAALLAFRPHEDILGTEDPGAYLNAAATYDREGSLFYTDELLEQAPRDARGEFLYGHWAYYRTKDGCLAVRNLDSALIGPHFQPSYSILLSLAARLFGPRAMLYVAPLFGILTAVALARMASVLSPHPWSGALAFILYMLNPLAVWHMRAPRPEMTAGFLLLAGWVLILRAWGSRPWQGRGSMLLGSICVALSPFFHVTAMFGVVPTALVAVLLCLRGRKDFLPALGAFGVGGAAFAFQTFLIADPYFLRERLLPLRHTPKLHLLLAAAALTAIAVAGRWLLLRQGRNADTGGGERLAGTALALLATVAGGAIYFLRPERGLIPFLPYDTVNFVSLTDLAGAGRLVSRPVLLAGWAGLVAMCLQRDKSSPLRLAVLTAFLPGFFLIGWMENYMLDTRRLLMFFLPVLTLSLVHLVTAAAGCLQRRRGASMAVATALLLGSMIQGRQHLLLHTDYRGAFDFFRGFAEAVGPGERALLAEYTRFGAPMEHLFGIPTLSLDNERRSDYRRALTAWKGIVENGGDRAFYFLTPFQKPLSEHFEFAEVRSGLFGNRALESARRRLPRSIRDKSFPLTLYRMTTRTEPGLDHDWSEPFLYRFDLGNVGLTGFANLRKKNWSLEGALLAAGSGLSLDVPPIGGGEEGRLELYFYSPAGEGDPGLSVRASRGGQALFLELESLGGQWWLAKVPGARLAGRRIEIESDRPVLLFQAQRRTGAASEALILGPEIEPDSVTAPLGARWVRQGGQMLLPLPGNGHAECRILLHGLERDTELALSDDGGREQTFPLRAGRWQWVTFTPGPAAEGGSYTRIVFRVREPWNPRLPNFPEDLAALAGQLIVTKAQD